MHYHIYLSFAFFILILFLVAFLTIYDHTRSVRLLRDIGNEGKKNKESANTDWAD